MLIALPSLVQRAAATLVQEETLTYLIEVADVLLLLHNHRCGSRHTC